MKVTTFKGADPNKPQVPGAPAAPSASPPHCAALRACEAPHGPAPAPSTEERERGASRLTGSASRRFHRAKWRPRGAARSSRLSGAGGKRRWRPRLPRTVRARRSLTGSHTALRSPSAAPGLGAPAQAKWRARGRLTPAACPVRGGPGAAPDKPPTRRSSNGKELA